jgi:hypothetical protein
VKTITYVEIDVPSFVPQSPDSTTTYRFALPSDYLPADVDAIPSIDAVSFSPATISLGEDLGQRASLQVTFRDHRHVFNGESFDQGSFWGKWRGRYGTKLRGCPLRLIYGVVGQTLAEMTTRHYIIETTSGPTPGAVYTIEAKDVLKFADDDRAQVPKLSNGTLVGVIAVDATIPDTPAYTRTLSPTGIGDYEYPASGYVCIGGKEIFSFTRVSDTLTLTGRAQLGSQAVAHDNNERVQIVKRYAGDDAADILYDLFVNYAGVPADYISLTEWQAETSEHLNVIYTRTITEPSSVKTLASELVEQAALAVWWDDQARRLRLQVLREISTDADTFDEDRIISGSLSVGEQPTKRISQIWTYYGKRDPTDSGANEDNFRAALATVDLAREYAYGSAAVRKVQAGWIETLSAAERINQIQISRFRDPPRSFSFDVFVNEVVTLATGYGLRWWANQDETGNPVTALIQVVRLTVHPDRIHVEAEEMLASGVIVLTNTVFLTTTGVLLQYTVPDDWNDSDNSVRVVAAGGGGAGNSDNGGGGGSGGAFSSKTNVVLSPGSPQPVVDYYVGAGGSGGTVGVNGGNTFFNGTTLAGSEVGAEGGTGAPGRSGGTGGRASVGTGTVKTSGGNGGIGAIAGESRAGGGGGGGAGGPNGDGAIGGGSSSDHDGGSGGGGADGGDPGVTGGEAGGNGGNNRNGYGGGTAAQPVGVDGGGGRGRNTYNSGGGLAGGQGGTGEQLWTQTVAPITSAGPGGGGGGGGSSYSGYNGGRYGGGGGGGGQNAPGGDGADGIIVLTWRSA